jgi:hypothetical protein
MILILLFLNLFLNPKKVLLGTWKGQMNGRDLTIVIEKINGSVITGYDKLGNNKRPITGIYYDTEWDQACSKAYEVVLKEPGDDRFDGVFTIKFVGYEDQVSNDCGIICIGNLKGIEAQGEWKSYKDKKKHEFFLFKKD